MLKLLTLSVISLLVLGQIAYGTNESWFKKGYSFGLRDGKINTGDSDDACLDLKSSNYTSCHVGYDLGFMKGCTGVHGTVPGSEYWTCDEYFTSIHLSH